MTQYLANNNLARLANRCVEEMEHRRMRPSLRAHNAVLAAYATTRKVGYSTQLLLQMRRYELTPDAASYAAVLRSAIGVPGAARLTQVLAPEIERAKALEAEAAKQQSQGAMANSMLAAPGELQAAEHSFLASGERGGEPSSSSRKSFWHDSLLSTLSSDPTAGTSTSVVDELHGRLARGESVSARTFYSVLAGFGKRGDTWRDALQVVSMLESWLQMDTSRARGELPSKAYAGAILACDRAGRVHEALQLLDRMERLQVKAEPSVFNAAIKACRHLSLEGADSGLEMAQKLLTKLRVRGAREAPLTARHAASHRRSR